MKHHADGADGRAAALARSRPDCACGPARRCHCPSPQRATQAAVHASDLRVYKTHTQHQQCACVSASVLLTRAVKLLLKLTPHCSCCVIAMRRACVSSSNRIMRSSWRVVLCFFCAAIGMGGATRMVVGRVRRGDGVRGRGSPGSDCARRLRVRGGAAAAAGAAATALSPSCFFCLH